VAYREWNEVGRGGSDWVETVSSGLVSESESGYDTRFEEPVIGVDIFFLSL